MSIVSSNNISKYLIDDQLKELFIHLNKIENLKPTLQKEITHSFNLNSDNNIKNIEQQGKNIYKNINELKDISIVMEHPEFYKFYYKYMQDWKKFKYIIILMKIYDMISHILYKKDPLEEKHNSYHKLFLLYNILKRPEYFRIMIKKVIDMPAQITNL